MHCLRRCPVQVYYFLTVLGLLYTADAGTALFTIRLNKRVESQANMCVLLGECLAGECDVERVRIFSQVLD